MRLTWLTPRHLIRFVPLLFPALAMGLASCGGGSALPTAGRGSLASYGPTGTSGTHPSQGGTVTWAMSAPFTSLDPVITQTASDLYADQFIYDRLVTFVPGSTRPVADLATSWSESPNGLTWTFVLRRGARFSNGAPITPGDVLFSIRRFASQANTDDPSCCTTFKRLSLNGDNLVISLTAPQPILVDYLATTPAGIVPAALFRKLGAAAWATHGFVGSGPFAVQSFTSGRSAVLVRNPYYWQPGLPHLQRLILNTVTDSNTRILAVRSGQADLADEIPYSQVAPLSATRGVHMLVTPLNGATIVRFNDAKRPFNDPLVREALSYATPRAGIIHAVFHGYGSIANAPWGPVAGWSPAIAQLPYSLTLARRTLARSGAPRGFSLTILVISGNPDIAALAAILQSSWDALGLHVAIDTVDTATFDTKVVTDDNFDVAITPTDQYWSDTPSVDQLASIMDADVSHANYTYYDNPAATRLYAEASSSTSLAHANAIYKELQLMAVTQVPALAITYPLVRTLVADGVCNLRPLFTGEPPLQFAYRASTCN